MTESKNRSATLALNIIAGTLAGALLAMNFNLARIAKALEQLVEVARNAS